MCKAEDCLKSAASVHKWNAGAGSAPVDLQERVGQGPSLSRLPLQAPPCVELRGLRGLRRGRVQRDRLPSRLRCRRAGVPQRRPGAPCSHAPFPLLHRLYAQCAEHAHSVWE